MSKEIDNNPSIVDMSFLTPMFDECYNTAIDRAIVEATGYYENIKHFRRQGVPYFSEPHFNQLISHLSKLKKQIQ